MQQRHHLHHLYQSSLPSSSSPLLESSPPSSSSVLATSSPAPPPTSSLPSSNPPPTSSPPPPTSSPPPPYKNPPASFTPTQSFASFFKENRNIAKCVSLDPNVSDEEGDILVAKDEDLLSIQEAFGHSLLGFVIGGYAAPNAIQSLIKSWNVPCTFSTHHNGWIVFEFGTKHDKLKVLENGPYSTLGRQWMLKEIPPYFSFKDSCYSSVPIWVNLRFLPKQCWSTTMLSRIAKKLGKPMVMDMVTSDKKKHDGARILVEVDLSKPIVDKVAITMPDGRVWEQTVGYDIKPVVCSKCKRLGHDTLECTPPKPSEPRGRSLGQQSKSRNPKSKAEKPKGIEEGHTAPKEVTHILSAPSPSGKSKEKLMEVEVSREQLHEVDEASMSKGWELVPYKHVSPPKSPFYARTLVHESRKKIQESVLHTQPVGTRPKKFVDDSLPISPNTFGPLFDEDERTFEATLVNFLTQKSTKWKKRGRSRGGLSAYHSPI